MVEESDNPSDTGPSSTSTPDTSPDENSLHEPNQPDATPIYVNNRIALMRSSPLSTKREKGKTTPMFRRPAPRLAKTAPVTKSIYRPNEVRYAQLIMPDGSTQLLTGEIYNIETKKTFFEQCFIVDKIIGKGSFGEVFAVRSLEDGRHYAVKVSMNPIRVNSPLKYREVLNHMVLPHHANIIGFVRAWEEEGRLYIQLELCQMNLLQLCVAEHALGESLLWDIAIDLLHALVHLHSKNMIHDDIKPENIFLSDYFVCKLGDFGLAVNLDNPKQVAAAEEGDSKYLAPEVLNGRPSKASDIFSLGVTLLEAATDLDIPSSGDSWHQIRNGEIPERFFEGVSQELKCMIKAMLSKDPATRPSAIELLSQPSIRKREFQRKLIVFFIGLLEQENRTPVQSPERSKAFAATFSAAVAAASDSPYESSDEEEDHSRENYHQAPVPRWRMNELMMDDEQGTSSSSSSAVDSPSPYQATNKVSHFNESPKRPTSFKLPIGRTPQSARRLVPPSANRKNKHAGGGDFDEVRSSKIRCVAIKEDQNRDWQREKYERMMKMEACIDSDENEAIVQQVPQSCPPLLRSINKAKPRAPVLDFSVLDAGSGEDCDAAAKKPALRNARPVRCLRSRMIAEQSSSADDD